MAHLLIAAAHKSSGKTTATVGLCAALGQRGMDVRAFKKGPDYIDPLWLTRAAGHPCHNLDFHTMPRTEIQDTVARHTDAASVGLIEANKGLHDGVALDGSDSNAALAKLLGAPVVLVIDVRGMTRGIAPLLLGFQAFDPDVRIAGVLLNQVGGPRHEGKLRAAIEHYTDIPVLGALPRDPALAIDERHLGLIPANEHASSDAAIARLRATVGTHVDLDAITAIAATAAHIPVPPSPEPPAVRPPVRIGIARDAAFGFYYPGDLEALEARGATLIPFDTLRDTDLPNVDGLFIGGGFPETHMAALAANTPLRGALREAIEAGLPVYAECGGLVYLTRSLSWHGQRCEMVGALPADTVMCERPCGRGYARLTPTAAAPWRPAPPGEEIPVHEFHYSRLENIDTPLTYAYEVTRGTGTDGKHDGIVYKNTLATYTHLRHTQRTPWTEPFLDFVIRCRAGHTRNAGVTAGTTG